MDEAPLGDAPDPDEAPGDPAEKKSFADKLEFLFQTVRPGPGPREFTFREVQDGCRALGYKVSDTTIQFARSGERPNPTKHTIEALAKFFGVPAAYFFDDDEQEETITQQLKLLATLGSPGVRSIATRAAGLDEANQTLLREVIESMRRISGIPEDDGPGTR